MIVLLAHKRERDSVAGIPFLSGFEYDTILGSGLIYRRGHVVPLT